MNEPDWYEVAQGPELLQGDLLFNCPVFNAVAPAAFPLPSGYAPTLDINYQDVVVLTQSCDLTNDKIDEILMGQVVAWPEAVRSGASQNPALKSREFRRALIAGNVPGFSLLHKRAGPPTLAWSIVDFRKLFTLAKPFVRLFATHAGDRLRLRSPYREHLAQAFARYFMRVGLPHDAKAFEHEGKVEA